MKLNCYFEVHSTLARPTERERQGQGGVGREQGLTAHMAARLIDSSNPDPKRNKAAGHLVTHSNYQMQPRQRRNVRFDVVASAGRAAESGEGRGGKGRERNIAPFEEFIRSGALQLERAQEISGNFSFLFISRSRVKPRKMSSLTDFKLVNKIKKDYKSIYKD